MILSEIPEIMLGFWQRTLLEQNGEADTTTLVHVVQTQPYHADIRLPANRPSFAGCQSLQDCSLVQLLWLATQQGFTGVTEVNDNVSQWHREFDFQPLNGQRDIGTVAFEDALTMHETGLDVPYFEVWKKIPSSEQSIEFNQVRGVNRHGQVVASRLLCVGSRFAYVRPRTVILPEVANLLTAIDEIKPAHPLLLDWLDFEISFGKIFLEQQSGLKQYRIQHSTLPFKEDQCLDLKAIGYDVMAV